MSTVSMELSAIAERLRTQDNAATAHPIFKVEQRKRYYGMDPAFGDRVCWLDTANNSEATPEEATQLEADHAEGEDEPEQWIRTGFEDRWEFVTVFFTEAAAREFIETQAHRLCDARVFVESGYRNREWQALRDALLKGLT